MYRSSLCPEALRLLCLIFSGYGIIFSMTLNKKIASDSIKTTTVTFLVQAVSFVISAVIAALYGATGNTDAYFYCFVFGLV